MNRKDVNKFLRFIPVSSAIIGPPRNSCDLFEFLRKNPNSGKVIFYEKNEEIKIKPPTFFSWEGKDFVQQIFLAKLKNARIWGRNGSVIGEGDFFIEDLSREFNKGLGIDHSIFYTLKQVKCRALEGEVAIIGTAGANIYYHWMIDILPRLGIITKIRPLDTISYFITEFTGLPFQSETLKRVGIPFNKIIPSNNNWNFHRKAKSIVVPSLAGPLDQPLLFQINFLRELYKDCLNIEAPFRKIYISRSKTARRMIVNEKEVIDFLARYDFEFICCEEMTIASQAKLFSESSLIICSHGSALTNLVFCQRRIKVLDIFNESHINPCFWFISAALDLDYHYISGKSVPIDENPKNDNTVLDVDDLKLELKKIGLTEKSL